MGATTIWERWDGIKPDSTFQTPTMNSFNHYAYGAIGDWMYRVMAGLDTYEDGVGYKHSMIRPHIGGGFTHAGASLATYYGTLSSKWNIEKDRILLDIEIPANTSSTIYIPAASAGDVTEGGKALTQVSGIEVTGAADGYVTVRLGSGTWQFAAKRIIPDETADFTEYAGKYKVEGGMVDLIEISLQQGKLLLSADANTGELYPVKGEKDRFTDASGSVVTFQRDAAGKVETVKVDVLGMTYEGLKMKD